MYSNHVSIWRLQFARNINSAVEMVPVSTPDGAATNGPIVPTHLMKKTAVNFYFYITNIDLGPNVWWLTSNNTCKCNTHTKKWSAGSVTTNSSTFWPVTPCRPGEFACDLARCLEPSMRCDNFYDCIDLTDELNCSGSFRMSVDGWIFYVDKQKLWVPFFTFLPVCMFSFLYKWLFLFGYWP